MSSLPTPPVAEEFAADPAAVSSLQSGQAFTTLLADDPAGRSGALEALIDSIADLHTRFVRLGNPLRSPLTIERLLIQAAGNDAESYYDRTAAELTRILAGPRSDETRTILVIEQAETLDAEAMRVLRDMSAFFAAGTPTLQILFSGHTAFRTILEGTPPAPMAPAPVPPAPAPAAETPTPPPATPPPAPPPPPEPAAAVEPVRTTRLPVPAPPAPRRGGLLVLLVLVLAVVVAAILWASYPEQVARVLGRARQQIDLLRDLVMPSPPRT